MTKEELFQIEIDPPDDRIGSQVKDKWDAIAKPLDGFGRFESITARIGAIQGTADIEISSRALLIMCADNGIVEEGVSQSGQEVTAIVTENMTRGQSSVCKMAKKAGVDIKVIDIGINADIKGAGSVEFLDRKVAYGTRNFLKEPAMTEQETLAAIQIGIELAEDCKRAGYHILAIGEMGIGNTTTSSAIAAAMLGCGSEEIAGKGAGLSDEGLSCKRKVIKTALEKYNLMDAEPMTILATVGGLDIAGLAGICIGGAVSGIPIVLDGVISAVAALAAERMAPGVKDYLIPSHTSREPAAKRIMEELGLYPVIDGEMALGEGTGAVMMFPLLELALSVYGQRTEFEDIGIEKYQRFGQEEAGA